MSKIQSESNSQLFLTACFKSLSCGSDVKDTIWKQFTTGHRLRYFGISCGSDVKDTIWKQFTTVSDFPHFVAKLWFRCQRYNLKAIHNTGFLCLRFLRVVVPMSKIQSESNSQLIAVNTALQSGCGSDVKDTIWKQFTTVPPPTLNLPALWFRCQRYNLKAIHNFGIPWGQGICVVVPMSKIQSESNSQLSACSLILLSCCGSNVKDTIWKQFTTRVYILQKLEHVVVPMSKIQSESNSQPTVSGVAIYAGCGSNVKDTIWKQFTT